MLSKTAFSVCRWTVCLTLCAAIAASAFKLDRAYYRIVHDEGLAALCAAMYAIILATLVFFPRMMSGVRRRVAVAGIFFVKVYVAFALGILYFANGIYTEMVIAGLADPAISPDLNLFPLMTFVISNFSTSRYAGSVVLFAVSVLLISFFEHLLEGISTNFDAATGGPAASGRTAVSTKVIQSHREDDPNLQRALPKSAQILETKKNTPTN